MVDRNELNQVINNLKNASILSDENVESWKEVLKLNDGDSVLLASVSVSAGTNATLAESIDNFSFIEFIGLSGASHRNVCTISVPTLKAYMYDYPLAITNEGKWLTIRLIDSITVKAQDVNNMGWLMVRGVR